MSKSKVSEGFSKFRSRNQSAIADAKKAENTMSTCKMPVGWDGQAVCTAGVADQGKDRKDDKGNTVEGRPFVRLEFEVVNDPQYSGSKFSKVWSFFDSEKLDAATRYEWFLNDLENLGLPREVRETYEDETELMDYFINGDDVFEASVEHNAYLRGDQKEVKVRASSGSVDSSASMTPGSSPEKTEAPAESYLTVGENVHYMGKEWLLEDQDGEDLVVRSLSTKKTRNIKVADLD